MTRNPIALRDATAMADRLHLVVRLTVEPVTGDHDTDPARLFEWYTRHGFALFGIGPPGAAAATEMRRIPRSRGIE